MDSSAPLQTALIERLWRTIEYEEVQLRDCADGWQADKSPGKYFDFCRHQRPHRALGHRITSEVDTEG